MTFDIPLAWTVAGIGAAAYAVIAFVLASVDSYLEKKGCEELESYARVFANLDRMAETAKNARYERFSVDGDATPSEPSETRDSTP